MKLHQKLIQFVQDRRHLWKRHANYQIHPITYSSQNFQYWNHPSIMRRFIDICRIFSTLLISYQWDFSLHRVISSLTYQFKVAVDAKIKFDYIEIDSWLYRTLLNNIMKRMTKKVVLNGLGLVANPLQKAKQKSLKRCHLDVGTLSNSWVISKDPIVVAEKFWKDWNRIKSFKEEAI